VIERPKRSVTRFFIPLIDVLILLFCIFLLMPFMNEPGKAADGETPGHKDVTPEAMRKEMAGMRIDLDRARREIKRLREERQDPSEEFSVFVLDIDPKTGNLFYYRNGKNVEVKDERFAQDMIDEHKRSSGPEKSPFFVILLPRVDSLAPTLQQLQRYAAWFKDVPHRFDSPLGPLPPALENKR
jgi:hypothetical protein